MRCVRTPRGSGLAPIPREAPRPGPRPSVGDYNGDGINNIFWQNGNQVGVWTESSNLTPTWMQEKF
jgi:hypothetical protein